MRVPPHLTGSVHVRVVPMTFADAREPGDGYRAEDGEVMAGHSPSHGGHGPHHPGGDLDGTLHHHVVQRVPGESQGGRGRRGVDAYI